MTDRTPAENDAWLAEVEKRNRAMREHPGFVASETLDYLIEVVVPELLRLVRELQAENARLRAALREVVNLADFERDEDNVPWQAWELVYDKAREALKEKSDD